VQRSTDAADQRRSLLALTDVGRRLITEVVPESEAIYAEIEKRFGAERLAQLLDYLSDLEAALSDLPTDWSRL
jgi:DNA-binding MarR family transcriptional regulator